MLFLDLLAAALIISNRDFAEHNYTSFYDQHGPNNAEYTLMLDRDES
jgi:hypothetical protein